MNKQKRGISLQNVPWWGPSLVVPWLGLCASAAGGHKSIPGRELRSRMQPSQCTPPAMRPAEPVEVQLCFKNEFMTLLMSS